MHIKKVLLLTPPFTQINTPYPATCYLKGYLNTLDVTSHQCDLSLEVFLRMFCSEGLDRVFSEIEKADPELSDNAFRMYVLKEDYLQTIDFVIRHFGDK